MNEGTVINRMKNNLFVDEFSFSTYINNLEIKIVNEQQELEQAKQLLINEYNINDLSNMTKSSACFGQCLKLISDDYDRYAKHLIIKDYEQEKVIAYVRIIDTQTAYNMGAYYSEAQFNLNKIRKEMVSAIELSHIVIAPEFHNAETLDALWASLMLFAEQNNVDTIIGTHSLAINNKHYAAMREIKQLKSKYLSMNTHRVNPHQILPPSKAIASNNFELPPVVDFFFKQGAVLCGDAAWNNIFKQAELFFYIHFEANTHIANSVIQDEQTLPRMVA